jgi:hypothetical protein
MTDDFAIRLTIDDIAKMQKELEDISKKPTLAQSSSKSMFDKNDPEAGPIGVEHGSTPVVDPSTFSELADEHLRPMLQSTRDIYKQAIGRGVNISNLGERESKAIKAYMNTIRSQDMPSMKLGAMKYGEMTRDNALLNYSRRYGVDNVINLGAPYAFWGLRSMANWAKRMIDKPGWFAMYARLHRASEKMEDEGLPTRLKGKNRMLMPFLPDWMGTGIWVDPLKQIFPPDQFGQPLEQMNVNNITTARKAESILRERAKAGQVGTTEAQAAITAKAGPLWDDAMEQAVADNDVESNPMTMLNMMLSPALWISIPKNIMAGTPEKISQLPITKTAGSVQTALEGTFAQPLGDLIGLAAKPEQAIRKAAGLSEFGQWGDWYIDRMLSNMAADGSAPVDDVRRAMIERQGPVYDMAYNRVRQEVSLRTPGVLAINAFKNGANPAQLAAAVLSSLFPAGIFPKGEMELRGLSKEFNTAWKDYKKGSEDSLTNFFENNPEYEARLALFAKPEDRLREFIVNTIWERYSSLEKTNRSLVTDELGPDFVNAFLNKETRSYESIDIKKLAMWSQMLGALAPKTAETEGVNAAPIQTYSQETALAVDSYYNIRNRKFPGISALSNMYMNAPQNKKREILRRFPQLKEYWTWNDEYKARAPQMAPYLENQQANYGAQLSNREMGMITPALSDALFKFYYGGERLGAGAKTILKKMLDASGRKMSLDEYIRFIGAGAPIYSPAQ